MTLRKPMTVEPGSLSDFDSWWQTVTRHGLIYRGDVDMEFMDNRHRITVLEFKQAGEYLSQGARKWLIVRAKQPNTEVRVVREIPGSDPEDPAREVSVWNPLNSSDKFEVMSLQQFRAWAESRAYRVLPRA